MVNKKLENLVKETIKKVHRWTSRISDAINENGEGFLEDEDTLEDVTFNLTQVQKRSLSTLKALSAKTGDADPSSENQADGEDKVSKPEAVESCANISEIDSPSILLSQGVGSQQKILGLNQSQANFDIQAPAPKNPLLDGLLKRLGAIETKVKTQSKELSYLRKGTERADRSLFEMDEKFTIMINQITDGHHTQQHWQIEPPTPQPRDPADQLEEDFLVDDLELSSDDEERDNNSPELTQQIAQIGDKYEFVRPINPDYFSKRERQSRDVTHLKYLDRTKSDFDGNYKFNAIITHSDKKRKIDLHNRRRMRQRASAAKRRGFDFKFHY